MQTNMTTVQSSHERMAATEKLLRRYPDVRPDEAGSILDFFRNATALEIGLLTCKDSLRRPIARFRHDHRDALQRGWTSAGLYWLFAVLTVFVLGSAWLMLS